MVCNCEIALHRVSRKPLIVNVKFRDTDPKTERRNFSEKSSEYVGVETISDLKVRLNTKAVNGRALLFQVGQEPQNAQSPFVFEIRQIFHTVVIVKQ